VEVNGPDDFPSAFQAAGNQRVDAVIVIHNPLTIAYRARIAEFALKSRLPSISATTTFAEAGGLMNYGPDQVALFRRAALFVDKILKGAKPGDLPVEQPTKFELAINLKTAKALGIVVPEQLLLRADQVIK